MTPQFARIGAGVRGLLLLRRTSKGSAEKRKVPRRAEHVEAYAARAFGVALWMALQSLVSIGVNLGLLPTKGLTLPLISSGGSSVLMTCAGWRAAGARR